MAIEPQPERLGCGRLVDDVWARIDSPPDQHELTCLDCQDARRSLDRLVEATETSRLLGEDDDVPRPQVKSAIMSIARTEVRRGRPIPLERRTADRVQSMATSMVTSMVAELTVSDQAIVRVVRRAADTVAEVRARRIRIGPVRGTGDDADRAEPGRDGGADRDGEVDRDGDVDGPHLLRGLHGVDDAAASITIDLRVSVAMGDPIPLVLARVRSIVIETVARQVGVTVASIDIAVEDVHES